MRYIESSIGSKKAHVAHVQRFEFGQLFLPNGRHHKFHHVPLSQYMFVSFFVRSAGPFCDQDHLRFPGCTLDFQTNVAYVGTLLFQDSLMKGIALVNVTLKYLKTNYMGSVQTSQSQGLYAVRQIGIEKLILHLRYAARLL